MPKIPQDLHEDHEDYYKFSWRPRLEKAINTLHGLVQGISADNKVNDAEVKSLISWVSRYSEFSERHPFNELIPKIQEVVADGIVDEEERADLLWLCKRLLPGADYYDNVTMELQELHGFLTGIMADGKITEDELASLSDWLEEHDYLRSCWPYDEVDSLVTSVMADGKIDSDEQQQLMAFFGQFANLPEHKAVAKMDSGVSVSGVCCSCPEITIEDRLFCFTGSSDRGPRKYLVEVVEKHGGRFHAGIRKDTDYLVIGASGNPCWAYSCYGRKVEDAMQRRQQGQRLLLIHEYDFWDEVGE